MALATALATSELAVVEDDVVAAVARRLQQQTQLLLSGQAFRTRIPCRIRIGRTLSTVELTHW